MNGLLLKDWIYLRPAIVLMIVVIVFCMVLFIPWGVSSAAFLVAAAMVLLLPVNAMTMDTSSRWDRYALSLYCFPAGRFWPSGMCFCVSAWVRLH